MECKLSFKTSYVIRPEGSDSKACYVGSMLDNLFNKGLKSMHLSEEITLKINDSCRVIQLVLPFLTISCLILLGFVFLDFSGPMVMNKQPDRGSLFLAGVAFFAATVLAPMCQRVLLAKLTNEKSNIAEQQVAAAARIMQVSVIAACLVLMVAACFNIRSFQTTKDVVHLVVTGFLLVGILCRMPTQATYRQKIDEFLSQRIGMDKTTK